MTLKFLNKTKDRREGRTKYYPEGAIRAITDLKLGQSYIDNGEAVEVDLSGNEIKSTPKKGVGNKKVKEDGKV